MPELSLFASDAISRIGIYDQIKSLSITRKLRRPSTFRLELATQVSRYEEVTKGRYFGLSDITTETINRIMRVDQVERSTESDSVIVTGRDFAGGFDSRICLPSPGQSHHTFTAQKAETIIKSLVNWNAGPGASDISRAFPNLVIEADSARGATITTQARYQALSDMLEEVLTFDGGGYEVMYLAGPTNMHQFKYISPTDRSASVFFDLEFESVSSQSWIQSDIDMRNALYCGGQGEGVNRLIVGVIPASGNPVGLERREAFVDARDLSTTAAVTARGNAILEQMIEDNRFTATLYERGSFRYGVHFFLGDIITLKNAKWNLSVQSRVISATLNWTDTEQPSIVLELDRPWPTIKERMQQEAYGLSQVSPKGAVDYHSENHMVRHQRGGADEFIFNPVPITGANLNALTWTSGFYSFVSATNAPTSETYWHVYINRWPDAQGYMSQIASPILDPTKLYYRGYNNSTATWSAWASIGSTTSKVWETLPAAFGSTLTWGVEQSRTESLTTFNSFKPSGYYYAADVSNAPIPGHLWNVLYMVWGNHTNYTNNYVTQIASSIFANAETWIRRCVNGSWQPWRKLDDSGNTGNWYGHSRLSIGTASNIWDAYFADNLYAEAIQYDSVRYEYTLYMSQAYVGRLAMQPIKQPNGGASGLYISLMTSLVTKYQGGVAPVSTQVGEQDSTNIIVAGDFVASDYGHKVIIELDNINAEGLMTWKVTAFIRSGGTLTPQTFQTFGGQRASHVGGTLVGLRIFIDGPTQFNSGSFLRIMARKDNNRGHA